jgi:hypothetical protein
MSAAEAETTITAEAAKTSLINLFIFFPSDEIFADKLRIKNTATPASN